MNFQRCFWRCMEKGGKLKFVFERTTGYAYRLGVPGGKSNCLSGSEIVKDYFRKNEKVETTITYRKKGRI